MNRRTIFVTSLQLKAHDRDAFESVWPHICAQIEREAAGGAQLIVLPEGTVPAYVIGKAPLDLNLTERALSDVQNLAQRTGAVIVYGSARMDGTAQRNSAVVVDSDGTVAGFADKAFLWHFDRQWFTAATHCKPVETSLGPLGVMICADGRIPTIARTLVDAGAEMLVMPTAWVSSGRDAASLENVQADLLARVRARENRVPFIAANKTGVERGCVLYCGKSQIVDANGEIVALAPERQAAALSARVQTSAPTAARVTPPHAPALTVRSKPLRVTIGPQATPLAAE
nr:carbon-nitrogen hydrolase family protein [Candidatus Eremiobacteraeota bacterium]